MLRTELARVKPITLLDWVIGLSVMIAASAGAYFLDGARVAAFGIVPAIPVVSFSGQAGITWRKTPALFIGCVLLAVLFYACATWYVWANPKSI